MLADTNSKSPPKCNKTSQDENFHRTSNWMKNIAQRLCDMINFCVEIPRNFWKYCGIAAEIQESNTTPNACF